MTQALLWPKKYGLLSAVFFILPGLCFADLPEAYTSLSSAQKQAVLWANLVNSEYSSLPVKDSFIPNPKLLVPTYLLDSFTHTSDELSVGRKKLIHAYGSTAKISIRISYPRYEGIFKNGGVGIARLSIARMANAKTEFTPGMAIKVLVDGGPSINLHVMNSIDGQGSNHNFFARAFSNILPPPKSLAGRVLANSFAMAADLLNFIMRGRGPNGPNHLPLLQACQLKILSTLCPYQIIFRPRVKLSLETLENDFRQDLAKIPEGTALYDILAIATEGGNEELIGQLVTESRFVASAYGDEKLLFSHASLAE